MLQWSANHRRAERSELTLLGAFVVPRAPSQRLSSPKSSIGKALAGFSNDADILGPSLYGYAKNVVSEVISVGRAGSLVDWKTRVHIARTPPCMRGVEIIASALGDEAAATGGAVLARQMLK